jgi:hypothetical protein
MVEYESIASSFGIAAFVPHLKRLIYGLNAHASQARRIHLVWQIENKCRFATRKPIPKLTDAADGLAVQEILSRALKEDRLDDGCVRWVISQIPQAAANDRPEQILSISAYVESKSSPKTPFGERATMHPGPAPLEEIFLAELSGDNIKVYAAEVSVGGEKALEWGRSKSRTPKGDIEPRSK